jgi:hypothetical protein
MVHALDRVDEDMGGGLSADAYLSKPARIVAAVSDSMWLSCPSFAAHRGRSWVEGYAKTPGLGAKT